MPRTIPGTLMREVCKIHTFKARFNYVFNLEKILYKYTT